MAKKILFLKMGGLSNININILNQLRLHFPDNEIVEVDVGALIFSKTKVKYLNYFYFAFEYGLDFVLLQKSRWNFSDWFRVTSYIFKQSKKEINKLAKAYDILFSFQTASLFDGSICGIPHFVYTDSTVLANLYYPNIDKKKVFKSKAWMKLEPEVYKNASLNFTFSKIQKKSIVEQYHVDETKVECVFAGMNKMKNTDSFEKDYTKKKILFAGFNWERKGGPVLLKAFEMILNKHPEAELIIVGCKPEISLRNCKITGRISLEELENFYKEATVFCMPSQVEPFGLVYIDAMHYKCPIVASNVGAIPEFVLDNHNGFTHHPDNFMAFANSLEKLLDNPELCKEFGENGYKIAHRNYTWEHTGMLIKEHINKII